MNGQKERIRVATMQSEGICTWARKRDTCDCDTAEALPRRIFAVGRPSGWTKGQRLDTGVACSLLHDPLVELERAISASLHHDGFTGGAERLRLTTYTLAKPSTSAAQTLTLG